MTIEEQAQILSEAVVETRAARHHYQDDIKEEERRMRTEDEGKSSGVAKAGLTTGIIRTALGALAGGGNGLLGAGGLPSSTVWTAASSEATVSWT